MEIRISAEELRSRRLFVATPCYGGMCTAIFAKSMMDLSSVCTQYGIQLQCYYLSNESLITRARNYCVDEFKRSNASHMLFIDSDIGFNPQDVVALLAVTSDDSPYDVIGAPYPKKTISWEKIKVAVDKGFADENPNELENFVGDFVFNPKANQTTIQLSEPAEVMEIGTGYMMIKRKTFESFDKAYPHYAYKPDHVRTTQFDGSREIMMYFQAETDPETKRYLSEDYWFCQKVIAMGGRIWLCPWMQSQHVGTYIFGGSLIKLAQAGVTATADPSMLKHRK